MASRATGIVTAPRLISWQWDSELTAVAPVPPAAVTSLPARAARRPGLDVSGPPRCCRPPPSSPLFPHALLSEFRRKPSVLDHRTCFVTGIWSMPTCCLLYTSDAADE